MWVCAREKYNGYSIDILETIPIRTEVKPELNSLPGVQSEWALTLSVDWHLDPVTRDQKNLATLLS